MLETAVAEVDYATGLDPRQFDVELCAQRDLAGDRPGARVEAEAAVAALQRLDVVVAPDTVQLLDQLTAEPSSPMRSQVATSRDGGWQGRAAHAALVRLPGLEGSRLSRRPDRQHWCRAPCTDLVDRAEGVDPNGIDRPRGRRRRAARHAGAECLPAPHRSAAPEADEAIESGMHARAEAIQEELDQLVAQLAAAFGLGGRDRAPPPPPSGAAQRLACRPGGDRQARRGASRGGCGAGSPRQDRAVLLVHPGRR